MDPLLTALIFSAAIIGSVYIFSLIQSKVMVRNMNLRVTELASELGLPASKLPNPALSAFYAAELAGNINDRGFFFTNFTQSEKKSSAYITEFSWALNSKIADRVIISKEGIISAFQKQFGVDDIEIGNPEFDSKFLIKCDNPNRVKNLLTPELTALLLKRERQIRGTIIVQHQEVHYQESGVLLNKNDLKRILKLIELCRLIAVETEKDI